MTSFGPVLTFSAALAILAVEVPPAQAYEGPAITARELKAAFTERGREFGRLLQNALAGHDYYAGPIDGLWGPGTAAAYERMMASDLYKRALPLFLQDRDIAVLETLTLLTSDTYFD